MVLVFTMITIVFSVDCETQRCVAKESFLSLKKVCWVWRHRWDVRYLKTAVCPGPVVNLSGLWGDVPLVQYRWGPVASAIARSSSPAPMAILAASPPLDKHSVAQTGAEQGEAQTYTRKRLHRAHASPSVHHVHAVFGREVQE